MRKTVLLLLGMILVLSNTILPTAVTLAAKAPTPVITASIPAVIRLPSNVNVSYKISKKGDVTVNILDAKKRLVYSSVSKNVTPGKNITLRWDCTASSGNKAGLSPQRLVPAGKYFLEIKSSGALFTKAFTLTPQAALPKWEAEEMSRAIASGIVPKELQGVYYRDVTERELYTLLYNVSKRTVNKINAKWNDLYKKSSTTKTADRNTAAIILCEAAKQNLGITTYNGAHYYFSPTFMDMKDNTFDWEHYDQIFFVTTHYDITTSAPVMRTDKYGYFNGKSKMSVLEAVQASYRLSNSMMPVPEYIAMDKVKKMELTPDQKQQALTLPVPTAQKLPNWSGLTLMNLSTDSSEAKPTYFGTLLYAEQDVKNVADFGFNFVRVPIFHNVLLNPSNKEQFNTVMLKNLDNLISYGIKYKVHICIDMHTLPGNVMNFMPGFNENNLFSSTESQAAACKLWSALAKRYADVPSNVLSFNLLNEPRNVNDEDYSRTMNRIIDTIRKEDPDRFIIVDGIPGRINYSSSGSPVRGLVNSSVAQAKHFYGPWTLENFYSTGGYAPQGWPLPFANSAVFTNSKPFTLQGDFIVNTELTVNVNVFAGNGDLVVKADGTEVFRKTFANHKVGVDGCVTVWPGDSIKSTSAQYKIENKVKLGKPFKKLEVFWEGPQADHIFLQSIVLEQPKPAKKPTPYYNSFYELMGTIKYYSNNTVTNILFSPSSSEVCLIPASTIFVDSDGIYSNPGQKEYAWDIDFMRKEIEEWVDFSKENNVAVMVQEFGCFNNIPNEMRLAYLNDWLTVLKENNIPWSMWGYWANLGIFNSYRSDIEYEYYGPYFLDRDLLTLLQKYQK